MFCKFYFYFIDYNNFGFIRFPDIPKDNSSTNQLMNLPINDSTTQFSKINAEKCVKAVAKLSLDFESCIDSIEQQFDES
jgi:hypothetical protein